MKIQHDPLSAQKEDALFCLESDGIVGHAARPRYLATPTTTAIPHPPALPDKAAP